MGPINADLGVYIHLPFCHAKCHFCDFATATHAENRVDPYLEALAKEVSARGGGRLRTLFIGGGTPTALTPTQINKLFSSLRLIFDLSALEEATVEANPESSSEEVLQAFLVNGIDRISFGLQSTQAHLLKTLNRVHNFEDFLMAYSRARRLGFKNINIDLMYGLPGQTVEDWKETLAAVTALSPEHLSAYALKVEPHTRLGNEAFAPDDDAEADQYLLASEILVRLGYRHYEISNFARPGFESLHNLRYWKNEPTIGLGVSAASYQDGVRSKNTSVLSDYIRDWSENRGRQLDTVNLPESEIERENVMLKLRLDSGVSLEDIRRINLPVFDQFLSRGLAKQEAGRFRLTPNGWLLSNQLFQHLVS